MLHDPCRRIPDLVAQMTALFHDVDPLSLRFQIRVDAVAGRSGARKLALGRHIDE